MGFEQLKYSPPQSAASQQQSPEKHKLISHSKQEDKKPLRSYQFGSSAEHIEKCLNIKYFMVDIKKDDDLARHSPTLADPRSPSPTLAPSFNLATLSTLATLAYTLHLADSLYTYFNYKKRNSNFTATYLDKILAAFSAPEQLYR